jgi:hypothetical protein
LGVDGARPGATVKDESFDRQFDAFWDGLTPEKPDGATMHKQANEKDHLSDAGHLAARQRLR